MSEPTAAAARPKKPPGKKTAGLTRNQWIVVGGVFAAALGYILWRRHEASKTAATTTSTSASTSTSTATLAAIEEELAELANQQGGGGGGFSGGGGTTVSTSTGTGGVATSTTTGTKTSTTTGTPAAPAAGGPITVIPIGLHTTAVNTTSVQVAWTAPSVPSGQGPLTGYGCEVYLASGQSEGSSWSVPKTQLYANAGGLKTGTTYHLNVWCLPAKSGGPHASVSFTTKKT